MWKLGQRVFGLERDREKERERKMEKRDCDGRCGKTKRDVKQVRVGATREIIARVKERKRERETDGERV